MSKKKKNQHYVWRHYLRQWTQNDKIYCLRNGKIFESNLMGVAQQRYFYKLKELTLADCAFIKKLAIDPSPKELQQVHFTLLNLFTLIFRLKEDQTSKGNINKELSKEIDIAINNIEEDYHANIEANAIEYIESILKEDIGFYSSDNCIDFIYYICVQYMRTNKIKSNVITTLSKYKSIDMPKTWSNR